MKIKIQHLFIIVALLGARTAASGQLTVTAIAAGGGHGLFLKSDGSLWAMGYNGKGQLGDGTSNSSTNKPEEIVASGVTAIAAGGSHSLFLKSDGSLWAMGGNYWGQLGDGTLNDSNQPEEIVASGVTAIAAGGSHSLFLKSDGSLWAMGNNNGGALGDGSQIFDGGLHYASQPEQIVASGVTAIAAGDGHSLFLKSDGGLWAMGDNSHGQLGDGTFNSTNQPEEIVASGVTAIAAGGNHSLFLKSDGSLWAMGGDAYGELGDGTNTIYNWDPFIYGGTNTPEQIVASNVTAIATGYFHSLFLKSDGGLWAMGDNESGQLGDGTSTPSLKPEQIVASGVTAIAAGDGYSLFLKSDGSLWAMGWNYYGQLGDGFIGPDIGPGSPTPEQVVPSPPLVLAQALLSKTNLQFTATCEFGGNFYLLAGTNLSQPLNQWTPVWTNSVTTRGTNNFSATLTNAVNSGLRHFYILQSQ